VEPIYLLDLASQQERWLTVRQAVVAQNIANANTPGYAARDISSFEDVFSGSQVQLVSTNPAHLGTDPLDPSDAATKEDSPWEVSISGNSVSLEQELLKAGDVHNNYSLNTSVVKAFNQMLSSSVKGS
jgi:flagellar basal-body rod protein FlgB